MYKENSHYPFANQYGGRYDQYGGGGDQHVFRGAKYQYGNGLGDILRGIGRWLLPIISPIAKRAATSFITNTSENLNSGQSLMDAAKGSLKPMLVDTLSQANETISKRIQGGSGRPRNIRFNLPPTNMSMAAGEFVRNNAIRRNTSHPVKRSNGSRNVSISRNKSQTGRGKRVYKRKRKAKKTHKSKSCKRLKLTNF